jgi:hypothetical protein
MASGDTLLIFRAMDNEPPATNYATFDVRNGHPCLDFDTTTGEAAYFSAVMPRNYSDATGVTVYLHWGGTVAGTGTVGWLVAFERLADGGTDLDADSFASDQTVTAEAADATSGILDVSSVAITKGANMDSVVAGDYFRIRITRDVANDNLNGDAELYAVEIKET